MGQKQPKSDRSQPEFMFVFSSQTRCSEALSSTTRTDESCHFDLGAEEVKSVRQQLLDELHELGC
jgi:hypothetical protein